MFAYDHRLPLTPTLVNQVYTPSITINYPRRLIGNGKEEMTAQTWAERLEHFHDGFDSTEHIIQCVLSFSLSKVCWMGGVLMRVGIC